MRIELAGHRTVDLLPHVLSSWGVQALDTVRLDPEEVLPKSMVRIPAFTMPDSLHPGAPDISVGSYFIDRFEVTNEEYHGFLRAGGYQNPACRCAGAGGPFWRGEWSSERQPGRTLAFRARQGHSHRLSA